MIEQFFAWYNVIFYVSILLGVAFVFVSAMGVDAGADIDVDADGSLDLEQEIDGHGEGALSKVLSLFGVGRCPLSIVMFSALLIFGGTGVILNSIFAPALAIISIIGATAAMLFLTRILAVTVSSLMPNTETYTTEPDHFIGLTAKVVLTVTEEFGQIHVRDHQGSLHKLNARAYEGVVHPASERVLVVEHKDNVFYVDHNPKQLEQ